MGYNDKIKTRVLPHFRKPMSPQHLSKAKVCDAAGLKSVYGVYGGQDNEGRDMALSLGTGFIWVTKTVGNLEVGDFLVSSARAGYAQKQPDDLYRNSTAAKMMEDVIWNVGETERRVGVIYLGG